MRGSLNQAAPVSSSETLNPNPKNQAAHTAVKVQHHTSKSREEVWCSDL